MTWGTNPGQVTTIDGVVPDPSTFAEPDEARAVERALAYMGLATGDADHRHLRSTPCSSARARIVASKT